MPLMKKAVEKLLCTRVNLVRYERGVKRAGFRFDQPGEFRNNLLGVRNGP